MFNDFFQKIFERAFCISKKNPFLWGYGFFVILGSSIITQVNTLEHKNILYRSALQEFIQTNAQEYNLLILGSICIAIILILLYVLKILALGAIWIITYKSSTNHFKTLFLEGLSLSKKFFWRLFAIRFFIFMIASMLFFFSILPPIIFAYHNNTGMSILFFVITIFLLLCVSILFFFITRYAQFYLISSKLCILDSINSAYKLFLNNINQSLLMAFHIIIFNIMFAFLVFIFTTIITSTFIGVYPQDNSTHLLSIELLLIPTLFSLFLAIVIKSIFIVFCEVSWFIFFKQIASQKDISVKVEGDTTQTNLVIQIQPIGSI